MQKFVNPDRVAVPRIKAQSRYADHTGENPENTVDEITVEELARRAQDEALLVVEQPFFSFTRVYVLPAGPQLHEVVLPVRSRAIADVWQ